MLPYERQLEAKHAQVDEALRRIGKLDGYELEPIVPAVAPWRYRNKLEYSFGTHEGRLVCGFHAPGHWEEIVEIRDCLLASEPANVARERVVAWCREQGLSAYDRRSGEGFLRNLVVREGRRTGPAAGAAGHQSRAPGHATRSPRRWPISTACCGRASTASGRRPRGARPSCWPASSASRRRSAACGCGIAPQAFFQTNTEMAEQLYGLAIEYADLRGIERVYDLYCGIGTIGLMMAPRAAQIWGLELVPDAIADAIAAARANEIDNARFFAGDVRLALRELVEKAGRPDVLLVDPPRAGLSQKIVRRIIEASPRRIVYVSCNPTTLAPNAAQLTEAGYRLRRVRPVDMFPQTPHIECVAVLDRV